MDISMKHYSRVWAEIDLDAILYNMASMQQKLKEGTKIMAVIKADGYGHGAVPIAEAIDELPCLYGYAVANVEEGIELRRHGITKPVLVLGYVFPEQYPQLIREDISTAVFSFSMAELLNAAAAAMNKTAKIHFAVDTGMSRIGYQVTGESAMEMEQIAELPHIMVEGIFTHFARADEKDKTAAYAQLERFQTMIDMLRERGVQIPLHHCSNSAGIMELPEATNMELVRAGITLYGLLPSQEVEKEKLSLRPVMSLKSRISYIKELPAGREISYGGTYVTQGTEHIATIPVGYADGYARGLSNKGYVLIHGRRAPIRGRICMDQFMVDVTEIPDASVGDTVTLLGAEGNERITLEELGELSGRFNYEFACGITKRVPRVFYQNGKRKAAKDYFLE